MRKLITVCQVLVIATVISSVAVAEYFNLTAHDITGDGTGTISGFTMSVTNTLPYSALTGVPTTFPAHWDNITNTPTTLAGYGITDALTAITDNSITPAKLAKSSGTADNTTVYYGDGRWAAPSVDFQAQLDLKQALDADLTVLSFPTAWRVFVSNGAQAITEIAFPSDNTLYFGSNGAAALPSFKAVTAVGNADTATALAANGANCSAGQAPLGVDNTGAVEGCWTPTANLDNSTMNGTVIGGDNAVAGSFSTLTATTVNTTTLAATGVSTLDNVVISEGTIDNVTMGATTSIISIDVASITRGGVSDDEFGYLSTVTSDIQVQIDSKRGLDNVTFTGAGVASFDNSVQATQFESTGGDNTHYINVANSGAPNSGTETTGDCYYDNTTFAWLCWDSSAWSAPTLTTVGYGSNPTTDSAGKVGIDNTANQFRYFGSAETVIDPRRTENATFKSPVSGDKAKFRKPFGMTVSTVGCVTEAADNVVLDVQECDANAANCATILSATLTCSTTYQYTDGTPSVADAAIAAGGYVFFSVGTVTGSVGNLYVDFNYAVTKE